MSRVGRIARVWQGLVVAAVALTAVGVGYYAYAARGTAGSASSPAPDRFALLQCHGSDFVEADIDYAVKPSGNPGSDTPERIVDRWRAGDEAKAQTTRLGAPLAQRELTRTKDRVEMAFAAPNGDVVTVLFIQWNPRLGWILESTIACS